MSHLSSETQKTSTSQLRLENHTRNTRHHIHETHIQYSNQIENETQ